MPDARPNHSPSRPEAADSAVARRAYGARCGCVGVLLNLVLFCGKLAAGLVSGSIAVTADAFNNLSDAATSVVTLMGFHIAGKRGDGEHPYGHGRAEYIAGLIVSLIVVWMGLELGQASVRRILAPEDVGLHAAALLVLALALPVKLFMFAFYRRAGRRIDSPVMHAAAADSLGDACADLAVLAGMGVAHWTGLQLDGWLGLAVALLILWGGISALREAAGPLLGTAPRQDFVETVREIVGECPEILGLHDLRVHEYGPGRTLVSLHAEVSADGDLMALHDAIDAVERRLNAALGCEAVIHMDPVVKEDDETAELHRRALAVLRAAVDERVTLHDFRVVRSGERLKLSFDAIVPYDVAESDAALAERMRAIVQALDERVDAEITVDRPFVAE